MGVVCRGIWDAGWMVTLLFIVVEDPHILEIRNEIE